MFQKINFIEEHINFREINNFYKDYNKLLKRIKFDKLTDSYQAILNREIKKALVRTIVRYDSTLNNNFINKIKDKIISTFGEDIKNYYITSNPYLLLHLPKDTYEEGRYHTDVAFNTGQSFTCWTPINCHEVDYSPITIFLSSKKRFDFYTLKFLGRISQKLFEFYANIFLKKKLIKASPNKIFFWKDSTIHKGNLNNKELIHSAVTFKITEKKNPAEKSCIIGEISKEKLLGTFNKDEIENNLHKIKKFVDQNKEKKIYQKKLIDNLLLDLGIKQNSNQLNKLLGFTTGIIGQRLSFSKFKKVAMLFCLISLNYTKNSNDIFYLKNTFSYIFLMNKIDNLNELI